MTFTRTNFFWVFSLFLIFATLVSPAIAGDFDHCTTTDAKCVGQVILDEMRSANAPVIATLKFYQSSNCAGAPNAVIQLTNSKTINYARCTAIDGSNSYNSFLLDGGVCSTAFTTAKGRCKAISDSLVP